MKKQEYNRKLKRLKWICDRAEELNTKVYDEEIETLSDEIEQYEQKEFPIPPPNPIESLRFHKERTNISNKVLAEIWYEGYLMRNN
jgi:antitoxin component HigA of HigAB toxin-antitoxin module